MASPRQPHPDENLSAHDTGPSPRREPNPGAGLPHPGPSESLVPWQGQVGLWGSQTLTWPAISWQVNFLGS